MNLENAANNTESEERKDISDLVDFLDNKTVKPKPKLKPKFSIKNIANIDDSTKPPVKDISNPLVEENPELYKPSNSMKRPLNKSNINQDYNIEELQIVKDNPPTTSSYVIRFRLPTDIVNELKVEEHRDWGKEFDINIKKSKPPTSQRIENGVKLLYWEYHIFDNECTLIEKPTRMQYYLYIERIIRGFFVLEKMPDEKRKSIESHIDEYLLKFQTLINKNSDKDVKKFTRIFVISFLSLLGNIISTFSELSYAYYFDGCDHLNLEIYASSIEVFFSLAEKYSYPLQLKITSQKEVVICGKKQPSILSGDICKKNQTQFEDIDEEDISYFPPFWKFTQNQQSYFRRYTLNDLYHDCDYKISSDITGDEQENFINEACNGKTCSIFRTIDRLRLIKKEFNSIFNEDRLKQMAFLRKIVVIRNNEVYEKMFWERKFVKNFLSFCETRGVKRNHHFLRNFFGEKIGFYFLFTSHYIQWLVYPSVFGIVLFLCGIVLSAFVDVDTQTEVKETSTVTATSVSHLRGGYPVQTTMHISLYRRFEEIRPFVNCLYTVLIILWGCLYTNSWRCTQKFYRRIWGMSSSSNFSRECDTKSIQNYFMFQGIKIPQINLFHKYLKNILTMIISAAMVAVAILINLLLIYISEYQVFGIPETQNLGLLDTIKASFQEASASPPDHNVKSTFWYYLTPIISVIIRTILSRVNHRAVNWSCQFEENVFIDQFENSYIRKITIFEFVNYYFYLLFVAYVKKYLCICANNDCFQELGHQLVIILLTSSVINLLEIGIPFVHQLTRIKSQERKIPTHDEHNPRVTSLLRQEYKDPIAYEYFEILFNYGYVILFGIASPICFIIALAHAFCERLIDSYKMVKLYYSVYIEGSNGIGIILKFIKIFTFLAIITNTTIIYFTLQEAKITASKWTFIFLIENVLVFAYLCVKFDTFPSWFGYGDQIRSNMIRKLSDGNNPLKKNNSRANYIGEFLIKKIISL